MTAAASSVPVLAFDLHAELSVIGAALLDNEAASDIIASGLVAEEFGNSTVGVVWKAVAAIHEAGRPVDLVTLADELRARGELDAVGGMEALSNMMSAVPSAANAIHYARIVREQAARRATQATADAVVSAGAVMPMADLTGALEERLAGLYALSEERGAGRVTAKAAIRELYDHLDAVYRSGPADGIDTGIEALDKMIQFFPVGRMTLLAARPGQGKTSIGLQIARRAVARSFPTAVFSLEMTTQEATARLLSQETGIAEKRIINGDLSDGDHVRLREAAKVLTKAPLWIDDREHTIGSLCAEIRRGCRQDGIRFVVVDYLQNIGNVNARSREAEVAEVSKRLTSLLKELQIPALILAQLNRGNEKGADMRAPRLGDIRESGQIEQDAALVIFLHGDIAAQEADRRRERVAIIAKYRNGATGQVDLRVSDIGTKFEDAHTAQEACPF